MNRGALGLMSALLGGYACRSFTSNASQPPGAVGPMPVFASVSRHPPVPRHGDGSAGIPALALATVAMTAVAVALTAAGTPGNAFDRALREVIVVATPGAVGLYATRLPGSARFGQLLMGAGLLWSLSALSESSNSVAYSTGRVAAWLSVPVLLYLVLAFPLGRLPNRVDRRLFGGGIAATVVLALLSALFIEAYPTPAPWSSCTPGCPPNAFFVLAAEPAVMHAVVAPARELVAIVVMAGV